MIYIFDIDGTLADLSERLHFITGEKKDWKSFYKSCVTDKPIPEVIRIARALKAASYTLVFSTGRSTDIYQETKDWLENNGLFGIYARIYMRPEGDHREDSVVKSELLDMIIDDYPEEKIMGVFEDRQQVVDMYRARGLRVFQVAKGDF
jgi:hypothetical protein